MTGPQIIWVIPILGGIPITETVVNAWLAMAFIIGVSIYFTRNLKMVPDRKQAAVEMVVSTVYNMVGDTMGKKNLGFAPYIGTLFFFSLTCSIMSMLGFRPPTGDINTTACWALITFGMIQFFGIKTMGFTGWLKKFTQPMALITPLNIVSELATPISLLFRHFGNIAAGIAITSLLYEGLASISFMIGLPIPFLQLGLPALLSIYFDVFTAGLQAFIFSMLTMVFVSGGME